MKLKTSNEYPVINGFSQFESAVIGYNNIVDQDKLKNLLPDIFHGAKGYLASMEPIQHGDDFVNFISRYKDETICIVGDYDCDGIMATCIMGYGLTLCGFSITYTISDRFETGYGMHKEQVDAAITSGAKIIITVDNGIVANEIIDYAHSKGLLVIVTDHHIPQGPNHADLVIDPFYNDDQFKSISGATVAFKLIYKMYEKYGFDFKYIQNFMAMAYFTVYSDVMPVIGENRLLIAESEEYLNNEVNVKNSFVNRLSDLVDFYLPNTSTDPYLNLGAFKSFNKNNVDYYFVPVINACNRVIGNVNDLVYDIMSLFVEDYNGVPHLYSGINKKRKYMRSELNRKHEETNSLAVVEALTPDMWDDNYSGIVGLVAADIVERENKPALIGIDNPNVVHFSGRSVAGFNLFEALTEIKNEHPELHLEFGGHAEALGASCLKSEIPLLQQYLSEKFSKVSIENIEPTYFVLDDPMSVLIGFNNLWPFGNKFEFPKFYTEDYIGYLNLQERWFTLKNLGRGYQIKYYDKVMEEKLKKYAFENRNDKIKCILSLIQDDTNNLMFKIERTM